MTFLNGGVQLIHRLNYRALEKKTSKNLKSSEFISAKLLK